jgi:hypothetical protein
MTRFASMRDLEQKTGRRAIADGDRLRLVDPSAGAGLATVAQSSDKAVAQDPAYPKRMNKTERRYQDTVLNIELRAGEITRYRYEALKLRLADNTFLTPDFYVVRADGRMQIREVKGGYVREDARMKFKIAAGMYPEYSWQMWQWEGGKWTLILEL